MSLIILVDTELQNRLNQLAMKRVSLMPKNVLRKGYSLFSIINRIHNAVLSRIAPKSRCIGYNITSFIYSRKLKNKNFSIITTNCIGSIIYHRLGHPFLSPTINVVIFEPEFIEFCVHMDHYLSKDLQFKTEGNRIFAELEGDLKKDIPPINVYFNHVSSEREAEESWERRKKRINKDNMYLIMYNRNGITPEQIKRLESVPFNNKVIFTEEPIPGIDWASCILPPEKNDFPTDFFMEDNFGRRYYEKKWDLVSFFNKK